MSLLTVMTGVPLTTVVIVKVGLGLKTTFEVLGLSLGLARLKIFP